MIFIVAVLITEPPAEHLALCWVVVGCYLFWALVQTIAGLLGDRSALLSAMVTIEQREQRNLAEALHDGALQYVLGARQELDDLAAGDPDAAHRIDVALTESARLLRTSMSQLHPAVIEATGLLPALRDLVEATRARGRFAITLTQ